MDVRHLKAFLAVFEERNITAAAQRLFISQPTLSVTIKQLEDELGVALFVRQPRGVDVSE
ncbi:LysR family transcriptional regulator, partial [Streptomyces sp. IBSBF 2953]|nr:LysR family transcriptional regulator [Streptomyces hayashii]